jgi:hypothetical protein
MTEAALNGARVRNELPLSEDEIGRIARYANEVDVPLIGEKGPHHRVTDFARVYEQYKGKDHLVGVGGEEWAFNHTVKARYFYANNERDKAEKELGYAIHYIQDAVCPAHVFPFEDGVISAHVDFEHDTWDEYVYRNWPGLVANATVIPILSAEDLRQKIINAAHWANETLACTFQAPDNKNYIAEPGKGISPKKDPSFSHYHWSMSDNDIGLAMERAAELVKGAAIWATTGLTPPTPPTIAYLHSSWGMQTMTDEISYLTSIEPGKYTFIWYDETNINDLWSNLNNHNILLIDEDTFYTDGSWSEFGGPIYDSFKNHASTLKSWVENGGAIFTSGESDLYLMGQGEDPQGVWWDFLPEGMQVKSYDPELSYPVYILKDPGLYSYPNSLSDSYLSSGHPHSWFTAWDSGYAPALGRTDNNLPIEVYGVFGKGCIVVTEAEVEAGWAWMYLQNQLNFIMPSTSYKMDILWPPEGSIFAIGQEVTIRVAIYDQFYNPVFGAIVSATSPTGAAILLPEILHSPGTGIYEGTYTILPTDPIGDWVLTIVASVGGEFPKQAIHTEVLSDEFMVTQYLLLSDTDMLKISGSNVFLDGDIHSNRTIKISGSEVTVTGTQTTSPEVTVRNMTDYVPSTGDATIVVTGDQKLKDNLSYPDGSIIWVRDGKLEISGTIKGKVWFLVDKEAVVKGNLTPADENSIIRIYAREKVVISDSKITVQGVFLAGKEMTLSGSDLNLTGLFWGKDLVHISGSKSDLTGAVISNELLKISGSKFRGTYDPYAINMNP